MVRVWRAGALLKRWLNECDNNLFSALTFSGGAGFRARILKDEPELSALLSSYSDEELFDTITNLGVSTHHHHDQLALLRSLLWSWPSVPWLCSCHRGR